MGFIKDFFSDDESDLKGSSVKTYRVSKEKLLEKLGLKNKNIIFVAYDYKERVLTIKEKIE